MSSKDVRSGVEQAKINESASGFAMFQIIILATSVGVWQQSWTLGIGAAFVFILGFPLLARSIVVAKIAAYVLGLGWATMMCISCIFFETSHGLVWILTIGTFMMTAGLNLQAFQWSRDIAASEG
jgi:hypothetical protein